MKFVRFRRRRRGGTSFLTTTSSAPRNYVRQQTDRKPLGGCDGNRSRHLSRPHKSRRELPSRNAGCAATSGGTSGSGAGQPFVAPKHDPMSENTTALIQPLHVVTIRGKLLQFYKTPNKDARPDLAWHSFDDLQQVCGLTCEQRRFMAKHFANGPFKADFRTIATTDGLVTIAPQ